MADDDKSQYEVNLCLKIMTALPLISNETNLRQKKYKKEGKEPYRIKIGHKGYRII